MAANRMEGIRAGVGHDSYSARQGVEHDDMNVLALGARVIGGELARDVVRAFLGGAFHPRGALPPAHRQDGGPRQALRPGRCGQLNPRPLAADGYSTTP